MKIHNYDTILPELVECPFCGSIPVAFLKGNEYCKKISITIKCKECLIQREVGAIHTSIESLEEKCIELWNTRR